MGRIWLLRGVAVAVFAVLVGAWAFGLAGLGTTSSSTPKPTPVPPDSSEVSDSQGPTVLQKGKPRRARGPRPSQDALPDPSPTTADDTPGTPDPTSAAPTPDPTRPSDDPPSSSPPSQTPSRPPSPPADECTDLASTIDCALDPVTGHP
ncbi:hypothetical protein [Nocardioides antri]|uniref:Uncharacterized protein n=1 Tax=Nocardioides antri TaxID=2607659 RepID=A0A5B1MAG8_9ACTN|nr:hypothetical protein [Nocardioides antri]KAA1428720.1 hypothetical protein F0U47_00400 [Nocardioides antri]